MSEADLTKWQKWALFYLADWDHEYGGLSYADGRSARELIKRGWVQNCVHISTGSGGVMISEMRYVITGQGRKASLRLGWNPNRQMDAA